jgi:hypothetical protein
MKSVQLLFTATLLISISASAQYWSGLGTGIGIPSGAAVVFATTIYNGQLHAAGFFSEADGLPSKNISKWDGSSWSPVGSGVAYHDPNYGSIRHMETYNGELYVTGYFDTAGGLPIRNIARWNGTGWSTVGSTTFLSVPGPLAVYNGSLYVAGYFPNINGSEAFVAKWDGNTLSAIGSAANFSLTDVNALCVYNGELYAAGDSVSAGGVTEFTDIVRWNGTNWSRLNANPNGNINCMSVHDGDLYVGGHFTLIDTITALQIAKWNGVKWSGVGTGIKLAFDGNFNSAVNTLTTYNGALYAGGYFDSAGSVSAKNIAKWDGAGWTGINNGADYWVSSLSVNDSALYVGGWFNYVDLTIPANKIAKWKTNCTAPPPAQPGNIIGSDSVCSGTVQTYSISPVTGASSYSWTLPPGWTGNSNTNSIIATTGPSGGVIRVTANNSCGNSVPSLLTVTCHSPVHQPGPITGDSLVCAGGTQTYFITPVSNAVSYNWSLPPGWTGSSSTNSITVIPGTNNGAITVFASNTCGNSSIQTLAINILPRPAQPVSISGNEQVCQGTEQTYTVAAVPGATGYEWDIPQGWAGMSSSPSILLRVGNNPGIITVRAYNSCGNSTDQVLAVQVVSVPQPGDITGNSFVLANQVETYTVTPVNGASTYNWVVPTEGTILSGQSTNSITIHWQRAGSYTLLLTAGNSCGIGQLRSKDIVVTDQVLDPFEIKLVPNPTDGKFYLQAKAIQDKTIYLEVLDVSGKITFRSPLNQGTNSYTQLIDISNMARGLYVVKIIISDMLFIRRIIKIR